MQWLASISEPVIRLAIFLAIFGAMAAWEMLDSWRHLAQGRTGRWPGNLGIFALDIMAVRLVFPAAAVGFAVYAQTSGIGLLPWLDTLPWLGMPPWLAGIVGFVLLDLLIYFQHRVFHHVPWLWRLHRMHHADTELDVTSGFRFHPLEILLSMLIKGAAILALGLSPVTVLVFETVLNGSSLFNHANIRLNAKLERVLRWIIVTPDMHRVHHSVERAETDSNFGFNLPWWDRLFGTHVQKPRAGFEAMTIGLHEFRDSAEQRLDRLVTQPFRASDT